MCETADGMSRKHACSGSTTKIFAKYFFAKYFFNEKIIKGSEKTGFDQKLPESSMKSFQNAIPFTPRRFGVEAHTPGVGGSKSSSSPCFPSRPLWGGETAPPAHTHTGGGDWRRAFGALPPPVPPTVRVHIHYWPRPPLAFCSIVFIRPLRVRRVLTTPDDFLLARGRSATRRPCNALGGGAKKTMLALLVETGEAGQHWETVQL